MSINSPWFLCRQPRPEAALRLFCLPFAGGGASAFNSWGDAMPPEVELHAVQLPGRESRFREDKLESIDAAVQQLADAFEPVLDKPYVLFGYSMGALLVFELARELRKRGLPAPQHLFVAARRAPQTARVCPTLTHLPMHEFLEKMQEYYDPPKDAWSLPELLEIILPTLLADMSMCETYEYRAETPLDCSIDAIAGHADRSAPTDTVAEWSEQTTAGFELTAYEGAHFFINSYLEEIQLLVARRMQQISDRLAA